MRLRREYLSRIPGTYRQSDGKLYHLSRGTIQHGLKLQMYYSRYAMISIHRYVKVTKNTKTSFVNATRNGILSLCGDGTHYGGKRRLASAFLFPPFPRFFGLIIFRPFLSSGRAALAHSRAVCYAPVSITPRKYAPCGR